MKKNVLGYFFCIGLLEKLFKDGVITEEIVKRGTNYYKDFYKVNERDITQIE
jgi:hypothetical protein